MQAVYNIAEICARHGITDVVLSPGSRSAPLTLAFARHPAFRGRVRVVPDERAAAFIGLGIAQATGRPVVLVCTSGTAGLNYAPAVAEAFFQQIPLLILTADRPPEWIDQLDGQTIRQHNLYGAHAKGSFDFPVDTVHPDAKWHSERIINEAINLSKAAPFGPVQVNVPLREPFYPKVGEEISYEQDVKIIREFFGEERYPRLNEKTYEFEPVGQHDLAEEILAGQRVLVVAGQGHYNKQEQVALAEMSGRLRTPVLADVITNLHGWTELQQNPYAIQGQMQEVKWNPAYQRLDIILGGLSAARKEALRPDILITFGGPLISKALKQFLREYPPQQHWHIQANGAVADTFRGLTRVVRIPLYDCFNGIEAAGNISSSWPEDEPTKMTFWEDWQNVDGQATTFLEAFFDGNTAAFNEFSAFRAALAAITEHAALHLANSMAVRYANILGIPFDRSIEVFANRGTSGIDGCTSTAVGAALAQPERPVVLLTGDVAFFYDRNAFWHNYPTPNLRVVLFNNHGGGIFRLIDGPRQQPELDEFFETRQALTAENTAKDFGLGYFPVSSFAELATALPIFFAKETGAAILEIFTDSKTNAAFFEEYRAAVKAAF